MKVGTATERVGQLVVASSSIPGPTFNFISNSVCSWPWLVGDRHESPDRVPCSHIIPSHLPLFVDTFHVSWLAHLSLTAAKHYPTTTEGQCSVLTPLFYVTGRHWIRSRTVKNHHDFSSTSLSVMGRRFHKLCTTTIGATSRRAGLWKGAQTVCLLLLSQAGHPVISHSTPENIIRLLRRATCHIRFSAAYKSSMLLSGPPLGTETCENLENRD